MRANAGDMVQATTARSRAAAGGAGARRATPRLRRRHSAIRWDRVGRTALLVVLGVILLLYISPVSHWISQSRTAEQDRAELRQLEQENATLKERKEALMRPEAVEREARRLGMVRRGERPLVVENLPTP